MMHKRDSFSNRFGILAAVAGSAVGLGNLWRFPYIMGKNGGAAFIILYLVFVVVICLPIMYSEMAIGRRTRANAYGAFKQLAPRSPWMITGMVSIVAPITIMGYYSVVGGWTLKYIQMALSGAFSEGGTVNPDMLYREFTSSAYEPIFWHLIFLSLTALIVVAGVKKGIEKYSKILMPVLFVMVALMAVRSMTLPGAWQGVEFLFKPDFSKIDGNVALQAMGQAFFSLSLGMGAIITYASYMKREESIPKTGKLVVVADTGFAILAGLAIMPAVFAFGIEPGEGPGLVFITVPRILMQLPLGMLFSTVFFFILAIAALTSAMSLVEVMTAWLSEEFKMGRRTAVGVSFVTLGIMGTLTSLSLNPGMGLTIFGKDVFSLLDYLSSNILLPAGGLMIVLFTGWRFAERDLRDELTGPNALDGKGFNRVYFLLKYIVPVAIAAVFLGNI